MQNFFPFVLFLVISIIVTWAAVINGYFNLPFRTVEGPRITIRHVLWIFGAFIFIFLIPAPILMHFLLQLKRLPLSRVQLVLLMQCIIILLMGLFILYYNMMQDRPTLKRVWKDNLFPGAKSVGNDLKIGIISYLIAMPVVVAMAVLAEMVIHMLFGEVVNEQIAIEQLKLALGDPLSLCFALFAILIGAPFLEEYLFRGILQSWLRNKIGYSKAIFVTALFFSMFHYSASQGLFNFPLLVGLFTFGCYLSFVYEKTRSLFATIILHVTFNFISVMRILHMN